MHSIFINGGYAAPPSGRDHRHAGDATNTDGLVVHRSAGFVCGTSRAYINNDPRHRTVV